DVIGTDKIDLAGMSMGGYVVFAFWRRHRDRVRSLILLDTKAEADTPEGKAGREKTAELVASQGMGALYETLGPKLVGSSASIEVQDKLRKMFDGTAPEVAAADSLAMRDRPDSTSDLATIDVPVLWLHGEEDALMPIDGARETAAKIAGAQFVSIPKGGHFACGVNPDATNSAIADFLKAQKK
ncbi:MAG: alpha/beta hydrolase, partial [Actinobacteria bacterium]|nr:alpha/beta hydrolase [Actinomycetota bacterium]